VTDVNTRLWPDRAVEDVPMRRFSAFMTTTRLYLVGLADWLCGCRHRKTTMPRTVPPDLTAGARHGAPEGTYIVCLECDRH